MAGSAPAWADFWSDAGAKFEGVTLHGVTEATPPSNYIKDVLAPEFEKATGIKVEIETTSWDQMYDKAIKDMEAQTGIYDVVYTEQDIIYAYLARNFLVDVTKALKDDPSLKAPDFDETHFTTFADYFKNADGDLFGVPMEAFIKIYLYRTDLFNDPEIQAAFKEKTGKDLKPATTHEEYTAIAEFFTEWGKEQGLDLWGTTAQASTGHPASWYEFFESIAPTFGVYNWGIDADNNFAASVANGGRMNSDEAKAALKYWLHLRDLAPPEAAASTWTEVATTFAAGRAAQGLVYGENAAWIASDPEQSKVVGNVGVALPPDRARRARGHRGRQGLHRLLRRRRLRRARSPRRTRRPRSSSCSTSARTRCSPAGPSPRRASPTRRPTTTPASSRWTRSSAATTRCCATRVSSSPAPRPTRSTPRSSRRRRRSSTRS